MDRKLISRRIGSILDDISRLSNALYAMDTTDIQRYPDNYEILSTDAALRAERIACRLRHLIYSSTSIQKGEYLQSASVAQGISIFWRLSGADIGQLRSLETGRRRSRGRHISGGGVARLFYLPDLSAAPSLWGIRRPDLHRPAGYPAPDGDEDGLTTPPLGNQPILEVIPCMSAGSHSSRRTGCYQPCHKAGLSAGRP